MELHHLRYFEAVARHGHVTRAAQELHIAQPSLSKQIQALEAELGVVLFDRVGRRVELTEAGRLLLPYARRVLRDVADARTALQQWGSLEHGQVAIGAPPTVGAHVLPGALAAFHQLYPAIELRLHEMGAARLATLLEEGTIDLAVISVPFPVSPAPSCSVRILLWRSPSITHWRSSGRFAVPSWQGNTLFCSQRGMSCAAEHCSFVGPPVLNRR